MKKSIISSVSFGRQSMANRELSILDSVKFAESVLCQLDTLASPQQRAAATVTMVADGTAKMPALVAAIAGKGCNYAAVAQWANDFAKVNNSLKGTGLQYTADKVKARNTNMRRACDKWAQTVPALAGMVLRSPQGASTTCYQWVKDETVPTTGNVETAPANVAQANADKVASKKEHATTKEIQTAVKGAVAKTAAESADTIAALQADLDNARQQLADAKCAEYRALCLAKSYQLRAGVKGAEKAKLTKAIAAAKVAADKALSTTGTVAKQRAAKLAEIAAMAK